MSERDVREALAEALYRSDVNLPMDDPLDVSCWDVAAALAPAVAQMLAEAEQRGREDNADHGMCYVHGSKALDARLAEARAEALRGAADAWQVGEWTVLTKPIKAGEQIQRILGAAQAVTDWLRSRAALTAEGDQ